MLAARSPMAEPPQAPVPAAEILQDQVYPLPANAEIREFVVGGEDGAVAGTSRLVYSNTLGMWAFGPSGDLAGARIADDITTTAANWCNLDHYVIMVSGDRGGDGSGVGPFNVDVALYEACPGARGAIIPGTAAHADLPDNGTYTLVVVIPPDVEIPIPSSLYLGLSFSRDECGVLVGAPPTMGFSADRFDFPGFPCAAGFGGFPRAPHASFYAEIYVEGDCPDAFVGYKNTNHAGSYYSAGVRERFADDVTLNVIDCNMVAYEIAHRGDGIIGVDLRSFLLNTDPRFGGVIPGTAMYCWSEGDDVQICRKEFYKCNGGERDGEACDPNKPVSQECPGGSCIIASIPLPQDLWVVYHTSSSYVGPLLTCKEASPGNTQDFYRVYTGGEWVRQEFPGQCWSGFELAIYCEGSPPVGACCDMILKDEAGDAVCRELPEMNCAFPELWEDGAVCESTCIDGVNEGEPCTRQADCPEGTCPGPFDHPCGLSACCKPDDTCENLAENECFAIEPVDAFREYQRGQFCGENDQRCPFNACFSREGDCMLSRPDAGCMYPFCCANVCDLDPWCCYEEWDDLCVRWAQELCALPPLNDVCVRALVVQANSTTVISTAYAWLNLGDPGFSCHGEEPCATGFGTVWFKFKATRSSARIHTCYSDASAGDSMIQVFRVADASNPEAACDNLDEIGCSDDAVYCAAGQLSDICVDGLVPGDMYYVVLAGKTPDDRGLYQLDIESPCTPSGGRPPNDDCHQAEAITTSLTPFDLAGATLQCPAPVSLCLTTMRNDIWYEWTAPCDGDVTIDTCGEDESGNPSDEFTPDTAMVVYNGCDCPPTAGTKPRCSESEPSPCLSGSKVRFNIVEGDCYRIRLGGHLGAEPEGELAVNVRCSRECPPAEIIFIDPPDRVVDARRPHPHHAPTQLEGINRIVVQGPREALDEQCWSICETSGTYPSNDIVGTSNNHNGTFTVHLARAITPGAVTKVSYVDRIGKAATGRFTSHPGNVNSAYLASPVDILYLVDILNGTREARWGRYSADCDHSGMIGPPDILCVIDLLNGAGAFDPWLDTTFPTDADGCWQLCKGNGYSCDGREFCKFPEGECGGDLSVGVCTFIPPDCPEHYDPVCGCDRETYANECKAYAAGRSIDYRGECEP